MTGWAAYPVTDLKDRGAAAGVNQATLSPVARFATEGGFEALRFKVGLSAGCDSAETLSCIGGDQNAWSVVRGDHPADRCRRV